MSEDRQIGLPGDLRHTDIVMPCSSRLPRLWHKLFLQIEKLHAKDITGRGSVIGIGDTGYRPHRYLPTPVAVRDFTGDRSGSRDNNGHGSHVAGIAVGQWDDAGISLGVAPGAELIMAKVLSDSGSGSTRGINAGREWLAKSGATIISESLGDGGGPDIPEDIESFNRAYDAGTRICVAALGNAGKRGSGRGTVGRPASYEVNVGVASLDEDGRRADYSSVGDPADIAAPGSNIVSCGLNDNLVGMSGTSMATPVVAGCWALIHEYMQRVGLPALVGWKAHREFLQDPRFMEDAGSPGRDPEYGFGIPQMSKIFDWMLRPEAA